MYIECPNCSRRYSVEQDTKKYELVCVCNETLTVLPGLTYRQKVTEPGEVECSVCRKKYDLSRYRNHTEIACTCGNILHLNLPERENSVGRRKSDFMSIQLQKRLHGLVDTTRLIHFVRDIDNLLLLIVRVTTEMLDSEGCSIILRDLENDDLVFHSVTGEKSSDLTEFHLAKGEGVAGHTIETRESVVVNDVERDARFSKRADDRSGFDTRSLICTPLIVDDECIGALEAVNKRNGDDFTDEDLLLAEAVSNQIAVAIHNVKLTEAAVTSARLAAVGEAITGVAHCVNNMLHGLQGALYVLQSDIEDTHAEAPKRGIEMLGRNMDRLKGLVQDMLTYSKDREPEYAPASLNELVGSVIELAAVTAEEHKTRLVFKPDGELPAVVLDQKGIYRCAFNLVSNAIAACESGDVEVTTRTEGTTHVAVEFRDNGLGMDEETLGSIFQPFFSLKGSKGTGLGLSVTQKIVQEHHGRIDVTSKPGEGSIFTMVLPIDPTGYPRK